MTADSKKKKREPRLECSSCHAQPMTANAPFETLLNALSAAVTAIGLSHTDAGRPVDREDAWRAYVAAKAEIAAHVSRLEGPANNPSPLPTSK